MLLSEFFENEYVPLRLIRGSKRTVTLYRYSIDYFSRTLGRASSLDDLTDLHVSNHLLGILSSGKSANTAEKERCQLLAIWRFAVVRGHKQIGPSLQAIPTPETNPVAWNRDQLAKLFRACRTTPGQICGLKAGWWWLALHRVLWDSAERIGAVRQLLWSDLNGDWMTFRAETRKGGRRGIQRKMHADTIIALGQIRETRRPTDLIFPWDRTESTLYHHYGRLLQRAGLDDGSTSKFHRMRRSVGTHLHAAGGNAQRALDHQSSQTTDKYIDKTIAIDEQPIDRLFRAG